MDRFILVAGIILLLLPWFLACHKESYTTQPSDTLVLSTDTLSFDTVFTTIGSATRSIKIYNPHELISQED
jgi:hypothetical protein